MKWVAINVIALLAAIAVFGGSVTYAASNIPSVVESKSDYFEDNTGADEPTLADLMNDTSSAPVISYAPSPPTYLRNPAPSDPVAISSAPPPSSKPVASSSKPPSAPPPSSEPPPPPPSSSEVSSEPPPSSEVSSEAPSSSSETPSSELVQTPPPTNNTPVDKHLLDMIAGAVQREIVGVNTPPQARYAEAYKAQAVACYSYMTYHRKSDGSYPTMSYTAPHPSTVEYIRPVMNQLITYNGAVINASYHAASGGATQSASYVWGNSIPYLVGVPSAYDDYASTCTINAMDLSAKLASQSISTSGDPSTWFDMNSFTLSDGGFIENMVICGQSIRARTFRESVVGTAKLKSCKISNIAYDGTDFTFTTKGYGHGAGMSQQGALGYSANEGWSYVQILTHYYQGTVVS